MRDCLHRVALCRRNPRIQDIFREVQKGLSFVGIHAELLLTRRLFACSIENCSFTFCHCDLTLYGKCGTASKMPERCRHGQTRVWYRQSQYLIPTMETH